MIVIGLDLLKQCISFIIINGGYLQFETIIVYIFFDFRIKNYFISINLLITPIRIKTIKVN